MNRSTVVATRSETVGALVRSMRYEVLPTASVGDKVLEHLPPGRTLTVTASVSLGLEATLGLSEFLARNGYPVVPHLAARMVHDRAELSEIVDRLRCAGVAGVFVPAGDASPEVGEYAGSLDLLRDLDLLGRPFDHVGVAGYPESHPAIGDDVTVQAMWDKRFYATHLVSNLCLDPDVVAGWVGRVRRRGLTAPVLVGMPGPVDRAKLLSMATKIGVGESTRFLSKNRSLFTRLAAPGGYDPTRFLGRLSAAAHRDLGLGGVHVYTFNQIAEVERWRAQMTARLGIRTEEPVPAQAG